MAKQKVFISPEELERRLDEGEGLRKIAISLGVTHQTLQQRRRTYGGRKLRVSSSGSGEQHHSWRGGRWIASSGYVMLLRPAVGRPINYRPEHHIVAEQMLGRSLVAGEVVHHINGVKDDNRPENLHICQQSAHRTLHFELEQIALSLMGCGRVIFRDGHYALVD